MRFKSRNHSASLLKALNQLMKAYSMVHCLPVAVKNVTISMVAILTLIRAHWLMIYRRLKIYSGFILYRKSTLIFSDFKIDIHALYLWKIKKDHPRNRVYPLIASRNRQTFELCLSSKDCWKKKMTRKSDKCSASDHHNQSFF